MLETVSACIICDEQISGIFRLFGYDYRSDYCNRWNFHKLYSVGLLLFFPGKEMEIKWLCNDVCFWCVCICVVRLHQPRGPHTVSLRALPVHRRFPGNLYAFGRRFWHRLGFGSKDVPALAVCSASWCR